MERPLAVPLFAAILGLSLSGIFSYFVPVDILPPLLAVTFLSIFVRRGYPFIVALALLMFACGNLSLRPFVAPDFTPNHLVRLCRDEPLIVEGVIDSRPEATERGGRIYLQAEQVFAENTRASVTGRLLLYVGEGRAPFLTGDRVRFATRLQRPRNYGLPGEFDYTAYLACRSVYVTGFARRAADVILIRQGVAYPFQRRIDALAARLGAFIDASVPSTEGAILRALLLGDMGYVSRATKDAYSRTGVNHILSISGFHVGVIALFVFQLLVWTARRSELILLHLNLRRFALLLTLPVLVFYLFLSGAAPATVRSVIMIGFYVLALGLEREVDPINSLLLAAACILLLSPPALFDVSFQLSFLALWGIIVLTPLFMVPFGRVTGRIPRKLLLFLMASAAATVATALPVAYYFHRVSATGLISNFFVVPLMGYGAVVLGFSALPLAAGVPLLARYLLAAAAFLVRLSNAIIVLLARIPTLPVFAPSRRDLFLGYLLLAAVTFVGGRRRRMVSCGLLACAWGGMLLLSHDPDRGKLSVVMLSVGQGESTLITFPDGRRMLVDGGGNAREGGADVGERLVAPALWRLGVRRIDVMVLTHPHPDHLQGLKYVAATFPVGEFWEAPTPAGIAEHDELHRILFERQVPVRLVTAASPATVIGGVRLEPLAPEPSPPEALSDDDDLNDRSLVFRLVCGRFRMLFTGDIGADAEKRLALCPERVACTLLKVPHHGSRYSSSASFLAAAAPKMALISAGYHNSFHLPAPATLAALERRRIAVYRTDLDGTIRVRCGADGENVVVDRLSGHFD